MEQVVYTFLGKKNTNCFVEIKADFVFSNRVTTNIQKTVQPTTTGAEHTNIISKHSEPHFPQCISPWLSLAGLKVHPVKQQTGMGSELPLALPHGLQ